MNFLSVLSIEMPSHIEKAMLNSVLVATMTLLLTTFIAYTNLSPDSYGQVGRFVNLSGNPGNSTFPSLATSGNNVYVIWTDNTTGNGDVYLKRSVDNGTTFGNLESISSNLGKSVDPEIAVSQDKMYIVWTDETTGNGDIYFKTSLDKGITFSSVENLSNNTGSSVSPRIAVSGNNVYVIWTDNTTGNGDVYLKRSVDNGTTFGNLESISSNLGKSVDPEIAVSQDKMYIVWTDETTGNGDIYFKTSLDKGITFSSVENLSNNTGSSVSPRIAVSGNNVYVVWTDNTTGNGDVYLKASSDNGLKFKGKKILGKNIGNSIDPQIAVSENNNIVFGIWRDNTQYDPPKNASSPNFDILFRTSPNGGGNFTDRNTIGKTVGDYADYAQIVIPYGKNDANIVWSDIYRYREPATYDLFFQSITNNGSTLNDPINLSNNEGNSTIPKIAISQNGTTHVVWSDSTTGNGDIYYSRVH